jgi:hypothetical protein
LFDIEGGPGAAASNAAMFYANEGKEYRHRLRVRQPSPVRGCEPKNRLDILRLVR